VLAVGVFLAAKQWMRGCWLDWRARTRLLLRGPWKCIEACAALSPSQALFSLAQGSAPPSNIFPIVVDICIFISKGRAV
jgi:hypothetical protein